MRKIDWIEALKRSIDFMEAHLLEEIKVEEVAAQVYLSPFYFQKGFKLITGYTIGEYVRNRRLYLAALELVNEDVKVINLAYKYGYDTPESFSKAFSRLHGASPMQIKERPYQITVFHPLQVSLSIKGADKLEYTIEKMEAFKMIGIKKTFRYDKAFEEIPPFWQAYNEQYQKGSLTKAQDECLRTYGVGMYGVSVEKEKGCETFDYYIAGDYEEEGIEIPEGLEVVTVPTFTWAKFKCMGPMPQSLQALNVRIFREWLPSNLEYDIAAGYNIEVYECGNSKALDYKSEIWIPVRPK